MATEQKLIMVCEGCGSADVCIDAVARWDIATQDWALSGTHDTITCQVCEYESHSCDERDATIEECAAEAVAKAAEFRQV